MNIINIEFLYLPKGFDEEVCVDAEVCITKGFENDSSDWDAKDNFEILSAQVFFGGDVLDIDVPLEVIKEEVYHQIRCAQISDTFSEESGGF